MENTELTHHGILGMKWGQRRFQNKDGTLTARGKKRYSAEMKKLKEEETVIKNKQRTQAKVDKLLKKRQELDEMKRKMSGEDDDKAVKAKNVKVSDKPKRIEDMTDDELMSKINRLRLEQTYKQLSPEVPSAGEKFINKILKPVGEKVGGILAEKGVKLLREKLGLDADDKTMKKLEEEAKKAGFEMKIRANERDKKKDSSDVKTDTKKDSSDTKSDTKKETTESFTGEVHGEGTSSRKTSGSSKSKSSNYDDPIYTTFRDISDETPSSTAVTTYRSAGKTAVTALLSGPTGQYLLPAPKDDR